MEDPLSAKVQAVFLNGKRLVTPVAFDDEEGWVDVMVPKQCAVSQGDPVDTSEDPVQSAPTAEFEKKRHYGKVEVTWQGNVRGQ
jgi:hypothetical protein